MIQLFNFVKIVYHTENMTKKNSKIKIFSKKQYLKILKVVLTNIMHVYYVGLSIQTIENKNTETNY